jgi:hypothetical protein
MILDWGVYGTESRPLYSKRIRTGEGKENSGEGEEKSISLLGILTPARRSTISNTQ